MIKLWNWIKKNPNRAMFLVPIILVAAISISHVVTWYDMANPINWAIYLSVAIEIAAMTALVAVDSRIKGGIWFMFGLVTFIQVMGNVFYCYKEIDSNGELFKAWVELTSPIWESVGTEITDVVSLKRWLAFLEGGLLPIISLTSLHFFITYKKEDEEKDISNNSEYFKNRNKEIEKIVYTVSSEKKKPSPPPIPVDKPIIEHPKPSEELINRVKENQEKLKKDIDMEMSITEGKEFNTPYPFTEEMKEGIKQAEEAIVEEQPVLNSDNEELAEIIINEEIDEDLYDKEPEFIEEVEEEDDELEKERDIEESIKKAEEWAIKEEERIKFEEKKKLEERKEKEILEAMKKAEELVVEEEKKAEKERIDNEEENVNKISYNLKPKIKNKKRID